ncbi:MAG: hypothetical protein A2X56_03455 [Nitrospirae bacterium GWC2_57_13]|nr:MAG: hypothetical protein A2X56_03455 [Nitrospirae bacterium GWC2_57_13]
MKKERPIKEFLAEAEDILEAANQALLSIESDQAGNRSAVEAVNALFRAMHSFKGLAGMFGLQAPADLAHMMESLLDGLRLGKLKLDSGTLDLLFETTSLLGMQVQQLGRGEEPGEIASLLQRIEEFLSGGSATADRSALARVRIDPAILQVLTEYEEHRLIENIEKRSDLHLLKVQFDFESFESGIKNLNTELKRQGEIICTLPSAAASGPGIAFSILVATGESGESLAARIAAIGIGGAVLEQVEYLEAPRPAGPKQDAQLRSTSNTVRVDIAKLDSIMNIVGDLHLLKSTIGRIAVDLRAAQGFSGFAANMAKVHKNLERKLNELQNGILDVRMVPIGQIFGRLSQAVRKYAKEAEKEIDLEMAGEETVLDKLMIEDLADPLMHVIRNAVDHGIEPPKARRALGKREQGTVRLLAYPKGNQVVIEVEDDGAGIDPRKLLRKAVEKGIVPPDHGLDPEADRKEILELIFLPGFSTSETVTEISGRGVGMDVVKRNLSRLSGIIDIETEHGEGTRFTFTLPITLAIIKALIIEAGREVFAVPVASVLEIIRVKADEIETIESREVMAVRDETVPLLRLSRAFKLPDSAQQDMLYVLLVGLAERRIGLVVDSLKDQHEIVIKPLGKRLAAIPGISGATELGDRKVVLVLDVETLIGGAFRRTVVSSQ